VVEPAEERKSPVSRLKRYCKDLLIRRETKQKAAVGGKESSSSSTGLLEVPKR
jgi:hypothetical protein